MEDIWEKVLEQDKTKEILNGFIKSRRVPHALIFSGPPGIGKFNTAISYAQLLYSSFVVEKNQQSELEKIANLQEPYVKLVMSLPRGKGEKAEDSSIDKLSKDQIENMYDEINKKISNLYHRISLEDANTIKISSIREIKKYITLNYEEIPIRFVIIVDADLMNDQSQNALLKSLEEPPEGIIFLLTTSYKDKLLPTILSRCWVMDLEPLSENSVAEILMNNFKIDKETAHKAAHFSEGSVQTALALIEKNIDELLETTISILRFSLAKRFYSAFNNMQQLVDVKTHDELKLILRLIKIWLNDVVRNRTDNGNYCFEKYRDTLEKFNKKYSKASVEELFTKLDLLENYCDKNLNLNVITLNIIFEIASLSLRKL